MNNKKLLKNQQGFTLIEIIAVLVLLGILAAVAVPKFLDMQTTAQVKAVDGALAAAVSNATMAYSSYVLENSTAPTTTVTYDKNQIEAPTDNIYEAITIIAKRAQQINGDLKCELIEKLEEFATYTDSLDEVFENKEQIEVSKFYEKLPKPTAIAVKEWLEENIYYRNPEDSQE